MRSVFEAEAAEFDRYCVETGDRIRREVRNGFYVETCEVCGFFSGSIYVQQTSLPHICWRDGVIVFREASGQPGRSMTYPLG